MRFTMEPAIVRLLGVSLREYEPSRARYGNQGPLAPVLVITSYDANRLYRPSMMPHQNPSDEELRRILTEARTIAVVGASGNPSRPSHAIMQHLLNAGYRVFRVTPREPEVLGQKA